MEEAKSVTQAPPLAASYRPDAQANQYSPVLPISHLVVFYLATLGLYFIYWCYRNWKQIKTHKLYSRIRPGWRTVGLIVPIYNLILLSEQFSNIKSMAKMAKIQKTHSPGLCIIMIIVINILVVNYVGTLILGTDLSFLFILNVIPMILIQQTLNSYWRVVQPGKKERGFFSAWMIVGVLALMFEIFLLALGLLILMLIPEFNLEDEQPKKPVQNWDTFNWSRQRQEDPRANLSAKQALTLLKSKKMGDRYYASQAIIRLKARELILDLVRLLNDEDSAVRLEVINILYELKAREAIPNIILMLKDREMTVRYKAANTLVKFNYLSDRDISEVTGLLKDKNSDVRSCATSILCQLEIRAAIPDITRLLKDKEITVIQDAVDALGELDAQEAIPDIKKLLTHKNEYVRQAAQDALQQLGVPAEEIEKAKEGK
ncbi:MAG: HEAT repeat domain-containing protein [Planctomycetes bacterium]|nr:HEAT repeat domain-containing protein [Planctomycetota bacterium]